MSDTMLSGTLLFDYLSYLKSMTGQELNPEAFFERYFYGNKCINTSEDTPFLSIVTRTQGKRPQALMETLLCLTAQTNMDFEILLLGHNLNEKQSDLVSEIVNDLPIAMREKVRIIPVNGGNRTTPLNVGFSEAKGSYVTILDDDDIVFDNWVETFYKLSKEKPGAVLHAYAVSQKWDVFETKFGINALMADGTPDISYCKDFNVLNQVVTNYCPTMSYACPRYAFDVLGIHFDETLTTTEDWDFLMRTALLTGVVDQKNITSIYRLWRDAENSQKLHSEDEWDENYSRVTAKFLKMPILVPQKDIGNYIKEKLLAERYDINRSILYYSNKEAFSEKNIVRGTSSTKNGRIHIQFEDLELCGPIQTFRFDPMDEGFIKVKRFEMVIEFSNGKKKKLTIKDFKTNGVWFTPSKENKHEDEPNRYLVFLKSDPQFQFTFSSKKDIKKINCVIETYLGLTDEEIDVAVLFQEKQMKKIKREQLLNNSILFRLLKKIFR